MSEAALLLAVIFMAYANGSNDNFKGVATLYGSRTLGYRTALAWGTLTTLAGSLFSVALAAELIRKFSGSGLVPDTVLAHHGFLLAVAIGTASTVILASWTGFPVSTTHALTGALLGGGLAAVGLQVDFGKLGKAFFLPLAFSPLVALLLSSLLYLFLRILRRSAGIGKGSCLCVEARPRMQLAGISNLSSLVMPAPPKLIVGNGSDCIQRYQGRVLGIHSQSLLDMLHILSGGMVSFARGLNDTPKLVALLIGSSLLGMRANLISIAIAMAIGGLLNASKVANTMSRKITTMDHGQGLTANLVTAALVTLASQYGLPVSTTHVSVGSITGIGLLTGKANARVLVEIMLAWIITIPIAASIGYLVYFTAIRIGS